MSAICDLPGCSRPAAGVLCLECWPWKENDRTRRDLETIQAAVKLWRRRRQDLEPEAALGRIRAILLREVQLTRRNP